MSSFASSRRKLFSKRKQSSFDNKIPFCTRYVAFGITDCETVKGSLRYCNYITVGRVCDREVTEQHFQTINYKYKKIKAEILKTYKKYLRTISKLLRLKY